MPEYSEDQSLSQLGFQYIFIISGISILILMTVIFTKEYNETGIISNDIWVLPLVIIIEVAIWFSIFKSNFHFELGKDKLEYKYPPFIKNKIINYREIQSCRIRKINVFKEFGGWGYRIGWKRKTGYIFQDGRGLELKLTLGKTVVFTTSNPQLVQSCLEKLIPEKKIN